MKSASIFPFGDKLHVFVDVHKLIHITGKKYGEHIFENLQITPHHNLQGCHRTYICKTYCKMFDSAKIMVSQRVITGLSWGRM